jgi:hypothetical protein
MLSAFSSLSGLGSSFGGTLAAAQTAAAVSSSLGKVQTSTQSKINWEEYNWPTRLEIAGLSFGAIHFDLAELKEKRDAAVYTLTLNSYRWFQFTMGLCLLNFVDSIVLSAVAKSAYPGINVLYSLIWALVWAPSAMAVVYHIYKGFADNSTMAKMVAKVGSGCIVILLFIMVLGAFGNINGFVSLGSDRIKAVAAAGEGGAAQLWTAMCVIESLLWMSNAACFGFISSQLFSGSLSATNTAAPLT